MIGVVRKVAESVGISPQSCRRIAASAHLRYKVFAIPKRGGRGYRVVAQPSREVKAVQRALVSWLSGLLPVHAAATAYKPGTSILQNAQLHANARYLTKLDLINFFPSIDAASLAILLRKHCPDASEAEISFILNSCLWKVAGRRCLCIGAPSSPLLSNAIMFDFDTSVAEYCEAQGVAYSRYSDDITISSAHPNILRAVEDFIRGLCALSEHPPMVINEEKRVAVGRGAAMRVTGLTLANNGNVTVGRNRKRGVRAGVSKCLKGRLSEEGVFKLKGELAFVLSVEPNFRAVLLNSFGNAVARLLPKVDRND